ncbi:hypothetical protein DPM19_16305 [Actinomadura craniellae]|uniref:Uncharacterized protein n=1 Tax=Actinomadura craniellae TaxID=2231787 RepID=A0A365H493_9ACTN|nr:hypothetical protein [Actinomadura craniellae]RAY13869.1 hypothetical protein DPM19_16305 [Actinomadura craniellae]
MTTSRLPDDDLAAALAARRELGPDYDDAFAAALAERLEQKMDARLGAHVRTREIAERENRKFALTIACVSLGTAVPLTAIAVGAAGLPGLLIAWIGLVLINVAYALRRH